MTAIAPVLLLVAPVLAALLSLFARTPRDMAVLQSAHAALVMIASGVVVVDVAAGHEALHIHLIRIDALGALMVAMLGFVGATGLLYAVGYMDEELARGHVSPRRHRLFFLLFDLFLVTMFAAVTVDNIALMWIAIEGSTLAGALLVGFDRTKTALEAGWKFIILNFMGIALALFGTVLVYYASERVLGVDMDALSWFALAQAGASLDPTALKLAFIFVLIGYGTKAGVAPMHTWLPDAHAEAPTPISAMLSGLSLNLALYAVLRLKVIVDLAAGPDFTGPLLWGLGLLSIGIAATLMLIQRDYKRLLAYSSVEHVGISLVGFGLGGPLGIFAGFFHMLNHALAKSTAFYAVGMVLLRHGHRVISRITGLLRQSPPDGVGLLLAAVALAGMPPFGLFISEALIAIVAYQATPWLAVLFLSVLALAFAGLYLHVSRMTLGAPQEPGRAPGAVARGFTTAALSLNLAAMVMIGLYLPAVLRDLLGPMTALFGVEVPLP
jgi:hydrogenase-4 component F